MKIIFATGNKNKMTEDPPDLAGSGDGDPFYEGSRG